MASLPLPLEDESGRARRDLVVRPVPFVDPLAAFAPFAETPWAALLDGAAPGVQGDARGRYAYIAADPFRVITANENTRIDGRAVAGDPFTVLARALARCRLDEAAAPVPFKTGAVGFFAYELGRHLERLPEPKPDDIGFPEMAFGLYDTIAAFDLEEKRAWVLASDVAENGAQDGAGDAMRPDPETRARRLAEKIEHPPPLAPEAEGSLGAWSAETRRADYEATVQRAIDYIFAGDVFQVNVTQRFLGRFSGAPDAFALYRRLRRINPAPYAAFLRLAHGRAVASASPESFLSLDAQGRVATRPIKGTRPRGKTKDDDARLAAELRASEKDRAENLMIVDLLRNDLSRVCATGTVETAKLCALESFASVHHLVSEVRGRLEHGKGAVDLLRATFPGGSITGAPKIRAMEIINELEPARRGPYCGAIAWLGFDGAMEASIVIRTLTVAGARVLAQAGGGIVADSNPASEYEESLDKIGPLLRALDPEGKIGS